MRRHKIQFFGLILALSLHLDMAMNTNISKDICGVKLDFPKIRLGPSEEKWPWMASLGFHDSGLWQHQCGASLIDHEYLLTAAHCVKDVRDKELPWLFRLGDYDLMNKNDDFGVQERDILDIFIHSNYNPNEAYYDVAIVKIKHVDYTPFITPLCLPSGASQDLNLHSNRGAFVAGWGIFNLSNVAAPKLKTGIVNIYDYEYCNLTHTEIGPSMKKLVKTFLPDLFQSNILCAGNEGVIQKTCQGDSGGPLFFFDTKTQSYVQVGIVSGSVEGSCGSGNIPNVFARIDHQNINAFIQKTVFGRNTPNQKNVKKPNESPFQFTNWIPMTPTDPKGVKFLDGIKLECPDNRFINSFQFEQRTSEFRYKYECLEAPSADEGFEIETYSNNWSDWGPWADHVDKTYGNVNFLDRQTVDCFGQGFLMSFEVETNLANGQLRYIYSCGRPIGTDQICESIQNRQTVKTDAEKYLFPSLRHHNVKCQENELISKFRLLPDYDFPGHIWYEYSCCQVSSQSDTDVSEATEWLTMIPKDTKGIRFLDQAKLQCPAQKFINAFQFEERSNKFRYKYTCQEGPLDHDGIEIETITNFWSDWGPWADHIDKTWGNVNFLDRQTVDCSNKGYLTSLRAETNLQRGQFRYIYDCGKLHGIKSRCQECKVRKTETLDSETFLLPTLRHHDVRCETNEVIKKFRLLVDYESPRGHVYYQYTCCNPNKYC